MRDVRVRPIHQANYVGRRKRCLNDEYDTDLGAINGMATYKLHRSGVTLGEGGPFGAVITKDGNIISRGHNRVLQTNDPTAHAEVVAIRDACARLGRFSLHDCVIYATCEPCPMCLSAIHWAKLPRCVFSASKEDAANAGFDDQFLYEVIRGTNTETKCKFVRENHPDSDLPFEVFQNALKESKSSLY